MEWYTAADKVTPHVVRISTPRGTGTGFLLARGRREAFVVVATAAHVIDSAHYWEEPIRIQHASSGTTRLLRVADRVIFLDENRDSAAILFDGVDFPLPKHTLPLGLEGRHMRVGAEIGWLGFPAVSASDLCFFNGRVSAYRKQENAYLVDGVAINGASGGPTFSIIRDTPTIIGLLTAYVPNRATGEVLPGLAIVRGVKHFHELTPTFASLDEAREQETTPTIPPPPPIPPASDSSPSGR
jgi:hypothetical protein